MKANYHPGGEGGVGESGLGPNTQGSLPTVGMKGGAYPKEAFNSQDGKS